MDILALLGLLWYLLRLRGVLCGRGGLHWCRCVGVACCCSGSGMACCGVGCCWAGPHVSRACVGGWYVSVYPHLFAPGGSVYITGVGVLCACPVWWTASGMATAGAWAPH